MSHHPLSPAGLFRGRVQGELNTTAMDSHEERRRASSPGGGSVTSN